MKRIVYIILTAVGLLILAPDSANAQAAAEAPVIKVYKDPACACCDKWVEYLRNHGYQVQLVKTDVTRMKRKLKVPKHFGSCHTAEIAGYAIEGHVPVEAIKLLLIQKPDLAGIAVPGMPVGSPGMEGPGHQHYNIMGFYAGGQEVLFMRR